MGMRPSGGHRVTVVKIVHYQNASAVEHERKGYFLGGLNIRQVIRYESSRYCIGLVSLHSSPVTRPVHEEPAGPFVPESSTCICWSRQVISVYLRPGMIRPGQVVMEG